MRFSIIGEGSTDFRVLKTILESFFVDSEINSLVPVLDVSTLKTAKDEHGSWTKIPEYLKSNFLGSLQAPRFQFPRYLKDLFQKRLIISG